VGGDLERWRAGLSEELGFWDHVMLTGGDFPDEIRERLDPATPLQDELRELLGTPEGETARILDVGAGPFTTVGKVWPGRDVRITAIDPLAEEYARLLRKHRLVAPVPTQPGAGEDLASLAPFGFFDLAHARNSLDHARDPVACVRGMLAAARPGGAVVLVHSSREADVQEHAGLHQWNFYREGGDFLVEGGGEVANATALAGPVADVATSEEGRWVRVVMRKRP